MSIAALENEMVRITKDSREKMAAFDVTNMELRNLEAKIEALKAAEKAKPPRNWPERIEAGMVFRHGSVVHMVDTSGALVMIHGDQPGGKWIQWERAPLEYLGTSFAVLMIRTDAHEPTGAELVGRVCEVSENGVHWRGPWTLESYWEGKGWSWGSHDTWYQFARPAK